MGSKSSSDPPPPPDPVRTIEAQARFNRINQVTPFGNLTFSTPSGGTQTITERVPIPGSRRFAGGIGGGKSGSPQFETRTRQVPIQGVLNTLATLEFSPEIQEVFDLQNQISRNTLAAALQRQSEIPFGPPDFAFDEQRFQDNPVFNRIKSQLQPGFEFEQQRLRQELENRGIPFNSEAFFEALQRLSDRQGRVLSDAATQTGLQDIALQQQNRSTAFNELASLLGFQQVATPGLNQFFPPANVDVLGAQQQALNQGNLSAQIGAQQNSDFLDGLFGLGQAAIGGLLS